MTSEYSDEYKDDPLGNIMLNTISESQANKTKINKNLTKNLKKQGTICELRHNKKQDEITDNIKY